MVCSGIRSIMRRQIVWIARGYWLNIRITNARDHRAYSVVTRNSCLFHGAFPQVLQFRAV
jgi:hypothetical protein